MATAKISDLPAVSASQLTDLYETSQSGTSKKATLSQVLTLFNANALLAAIAQVNGLQTSLDAKAALAGATMTGDLILNADPSIALQATTKQYVDALVAGISTGLVPKSPCRLGTTANLTATYNNGASGVGATLTNAGAQAALSIDGVAVVVADRILVKDQTLPAQNGIWVATAIGSGVTNWILTRSTDYDTSAEIVTNTYTVINEGATNEGGLYIMTTAGAITVGTTAIIFDLFNNIVAGFGLTKMGNVISVISGLFLEASNNLSDLDDAAAGRVNLELGDAATKTATDGTEDFLGSFVGAAGSTTIGNLLTFADINGSYQDSGFTPHSVAATAYNWIQGGNFDTNPWLLGTSFTSITNNQYLADRFFYTAAAATGVLDCARTVDAPSVAQAGFLSQNCMNFTVATADTSIGATQRHGFCYRMLGYDWAFLAQKAFKLKFFARSSVTGTYCVAFQNGGTDRFYIATYTIVSANTWEIQEIDVSASPTGGNWSYAGGIGLSIIWNLATGSNFQGTAGSWQTGAKYATSAQANFMATVGNTFRIQPIQMTAGSTTYPFIVRPESEDFALCEQYQFSTFPKGVAPDSATGTEGAFFVRNQTNTSGFGGQLLFSQTMHDLPTITTYNPITAANSNWRDVTNNAARTAAVDVISTTGVSLTGAAGGSGGNSSSNYIHVLAQANL